MRGSPALSPDAPPPSLPNALQPTAAPLRLKPTFPDTRLDRGMDPTSSLFPSQTANWNDSKERYKMGCTTETKNTETRMTRESNKSEESEGGPDRDRILGRKGGSRKDSLKVLSGR